MPFPQLVVDGAEDLRPGVEVDTLRPQLGVDRRAVAALDEHRHPALDLPRADPVGGLVQPDVRDVVPAHRPRPQQAADTQAVGPDVGTHLQDAAGADDPDGGDDARDDPDAVAGEAELLDRAPGEQAESHRLPADHQPTAGAGRVWTDPRVAHETSMPMPAR